MSKDVMILGKVDHKVLADVVNRFDEELKKEREKSKKLGNIIASMTKDNPDLYTKYVTDDSVQ